MANSIPQDQLNERQLQRLAAQRYLYSKAKKLLGLQMILTAPAALVWSIVVAIRPNLKVYAAFWGLSIGLLDTLVLDRFQRSWKQQAAKIQELFDCDVLHLTWRDFKIDRRPDPENVVAAAKKFQRSDPDYSTLKNWYPTSVGQLPLNLGRIVCQRANCWWDVALRRRYAFLVITILAILILAVFAVGIIAGMPLETFFLAILAPLTPAFILGIREYNRHMESAKTLDRLKNHADDIWRKAVGNELSPIQLEYESRELQDEIYNHRQSSPLIFDWIYARLRRQHEEQMNKAASELVDEALASGSLKD
jgi:hypothetical protein